MNNNFPKCTLDFYQSFAEDQMAFAYLGPISDDITELIIETNIEYIPPNKSITLKRRFSFLLAESFQNLIRHSNKESKQGLSDVFFLSTQRNNLYFINSINSIPRIEEEELAQRLNYINSIEPENLRTLYLSLLDKNEFNSHGGAGLGLLEMVRKSGQKLQFGFESISTTESLFVLQLLLNGSNIFAVPQSKEVVMNTYFQMKEQKIVFALKGRFIDSCMPVSLQAVMKIMQILVIKAEIINVLLDKAQLFILIHNDLQKKYNTHIHFLLILKQVSERHYLFTFCSEVPLSYQDDYEVDEIKKLNSDGFSTCYNTVNQSTWLSLSAIIE
jgi:hypothetical protein